MAFVVEDLSLLSSAVEGEVRLSDSDRAIYAVDASNYRQVPLGVVIPKTEQDIITTVNFCRQRGLPVLSRGGATSLAGQCCNEAVILDMSKYMNSILDIDVKNQTAWVEPGIVLDDLNKAVEPYGLMVGPDPATHSQCTLGGMVGNNACGVHAQMSGRMEFNVAGLEVLTYRGLKLKLGPMNPQKMSELLNQNTEEAQIYRQLKGLVDHYRTQVKQSIPHIPRRVSGFNLEALLPENNFDLARSLVGTEGTCVVLLKIGVKLLPKPKARVLVVLGYDHIEEAADQIADINKFSPIGLEGMDQRLVLNLREKHMHEEAVQDLPDARSWLLVEFGGETVEEARRKAHRLKHRARRKDVKSIHVFEDSAEQEKIWALRESGLAATAHVPSQNEAWPGWEDAAVPPERLGSYLRDFRRLLKKYSYTASLYGHFGQGCIHCRIDFELRTEEGLKNYRKFVKEAAELVVQYGGSLSGEHGDGQARGELLSIMYPNELMLAFIKFKEIWDPDWKMNPGKILKPDGVTDNLKLGTDYNPPHWPTKFALSLDEGSLAKASLRCVGVGKCRKTGQGTMCPSYMVTREEKHSTRGRAHLFFEMLHGHPVKDGWQSEGVKDALDLCLACKACKSECPVNVDMATYKAEFLYHYYQDKRRPRSAYAFGFIFKWLAIGESVGFLVNFVSQTPGLKWLAKQLAGISSERQIPKLAGRSFKKSVKKFESRNPQGERVLIWADTFNNYFYPEVLKAALNVLEKLGFKTEVIQSQVCCGRPLYDYGFLDQAKKKLEDCVETLRTEIRKGTPIVGLEPSCVAVFRDELTEMLPHDYDAFRLSRQFFTIGEFLNNRNVDLPMSQHVHQALYHAHCHHEAVMGCGNDIENLRRTGLEVKKLDTGCCGMAGAFGFEKEHYEVSKKAAEQRLLPALSDSDKDSFIVADGFSCREQIRQLASRKALHSSQLLDLALSSNRP